MGEIRLLSSLAFGHPPPEDLVKDGVEPSRLAFLRSLMKRNRCNWSFGMLAAMPSRSLVPCRPTRKARLPDENV